ncbi:MAG: zinc-binding dehydrogenase [Actinomycetota bacterium]|nr:zinc-binding dehydrogenase [Actinomycetota bacterium]
MRAIQITEFGGPEVLTLAEVDDPTPVGPMALIDVSTAGINYADTHQTENSYLAPQQLPLIPGAEIAGTTADGRRVVALLAGGGGYAEQALAHPSVTFDLPDQVDDLTALALVVQGTTAWHLLRTCAHLSGGESVVVHSAAGGVGSLAVQLARAWGAGRVIATASSDAKRQQALDLGAQVAVDVSDLDADGVRDALVAANDGQEVDIVLEMTGGPVFDGSLAALAPLGRLVTYGLASRTPPTPVPATALMATSRAVIGFWLVHSLRRPGGLGPPMEELLSLAASGGLVAVDGGHYPLADARRAHEDIRSRRTTGKLVLDVRS